MLRPEYLQPGDRIRIVAPAGKVVKEKILDGVNLLRQQGFEVIPGDHVFDAHFQFAATDQNRLNDLQQALDDPHCKAIICARGGYGTIRLIDQIDLSAFRKHPKWLVGFSDITTLHARLQQEGFCSIHGAMPAFYLKDNQPTESFNELMKTLTGTLPATTVASHPFNRTGQTSGTLIGGNLSILYSLLGTPLEPQTEGRILFIEDLSEYLYHLDRMMHSLKLAGKLSKLNGLIVGGFTEMKDNDSPFGQTAGEIIRDVLKDEHFPVCFDFPAGHIERNLPLVFGANYQLSVDTEKAVLTTT
ncbi:LD-carboxypeptidase [uncultured Sunxiuqinia sp.]|uniref:S66 peptidase family protein n=1 Tax=uncultured Sunxiuqinia sp. TaxID=1573825 RepID=UPI00260EA3BE|nr:LD-carboxypeptidase [uncultured Sunxiuqinia sp.]